MEANSNDSLNQLRFLLKHLALGTDAPIEGRRIFEIEINQMEKAGSVDNIKYWSDWIWTPGQKSVLHSKEIFPKVMLIGSNGSGKTLVLIDKASDVKEHVFFGIQCSGIEPLIALKIDKEIRNTKEKAATVMCFQSFTELFEIDMTNTRVFLDEIDDESAELQSWCQKTNALSIWMAIGFTRQSKNSYEELRNAFTTKYPEWKIPVLNYSMRNPKKVFDLMKKGDYDISRTTFNLSKVNKISQLPPNFVFGRDPIIKEVNKNFMKIFNECLEIIEKNCSLDKERLLIVFDFKYKKGIFKKDELDEAINDLKNDGENEKLCDETNMDRGKYAFILIKIKALKNRGRPRPLFWTNHESEILNSKRQDVQNWVTKKCESKKDLITDWQCVQGFDNNIVIGIGFNPPDNYFGASRCKGQYCCISY